MGRRSLTALALDPISQEDMTAMLAAVAPDLDAATVREIVGRADGIPLYAVEFLRMLVADGRLKEADGRYRATGELGHWPYPQSLRGLITARLDALPADDRRFLQDASVLGQSFGVGGLAAVLGRRRCRPGSSAAWTGSTRAAGVRN